MTFLSSAGKQPASARPDVVANRLLALLPAEDRARLSLLLEPVVLAAGCPLQEPECRLGHVWFPQTAVIALVRTTCEGAAMQVAMTGCEGVAGMPGPIMRGAELWVQFPGTALRLRAEVLELELARSPALCAAAVHALGQQAVQAGQIALCSRHHPLSQQVCRWLLESLDRVGGTRLRITQEAIAGLLGVRREGVSEAARWLKGEGVIEYSRGRIEVLEPARLETLACDCHRALREARAAALPPAVDQHGR